MTSAPAIGFEYAPSRAMEWALAGTASLAGMAVWLSAMPWWGCLVASFALVAALILKCRRWRQAPVGGAVWASDGSWVLREASSEATATLLSFRDLAGCLWLRFETASRGPVSLLLAPDNSGADLRRRLRMRLAATCTDTATAVP